MRLDPLKSDPVKSNRFLFYLCVFSLSLSLSVCLSRSNPAVSFRLVFHPIQSPRPPRLQLDPVVFHSDVILRHPIRNSRILSNPIRSDSVPFSRGEEARRRIADCGLRVAGCGLQVAGCRPGAGRPHLHILLGAAGMVFAYCWRSIGG